MSEIKLEPDPGGGIREALHKLAESIATPSEEVESFEKDFGAFNANILDVRGKGGQIEMPKADKGEHPLTQNRINDLRSKVLQLDMFGLKDSQCHMLALPTFDEKKKRLEVKVVAIDPASKAKHRDIMAALESVYQMVAFINADNQRARNFSRVQEVLLECIAYMENDISGGALGARRSGDSGADVYKAHEVLNVLPFADSPSLIDYCYGHVYDNPKMAAMLQSLYASDVKREHFRVWLEAVTVDDYELYDFADRFKKNVKKKVQEYVKGYEEELKNNLRVRIEEKNKAIQATVGAVALKAAGVIAEPAVVEAPAAMEEADDRPFLLVQSRAPQTVPSAPAAKRLPAARIVDVGRTDEKIEPQIPAEEKLAKEFADFIAALTRKGVTFSFGDFSKICELIFSDDIPWIRSNEVDINELKSLGFRKLFPAGDDGYYSFEDFCSQLHFWKKDLSAGGMLKDETRQEFMKALRRVNK